MSSALPVAVIGCGHLGTFHARLYREMPEADLRMVMDIVPEKAESLGTSLGVPWTADPQAALRQAEAVSVTTPTSTHAEVSSRCLEAGRHVLVEKPITAKEEEAEALLALARQRGLVLAVGHVERFNPAYRAARARMGTTRFVEAHRLATFVPRSLDVDVVLDLMIHDLDLTLDLVAAPVESIDAVGVPVLTHGEDIANARIRFAGGAVANLTASRVSRERARKIRLFGERRYLSIDLMERRIEEVVLEDGALDPDPSALAVAASLLSGGERERSAEPDPADDTAGGGSTAELLAYFQARRLRLHHATHPFVEANPLRDELRDFVFAVHGRPLEGASGEAGARALRLALLVRRQVHESLARMGLPLPGS